MTEDKFLQLWRSEHILYEILGSHVVAATMKHLTERLGPERSSSLLKIPPSHRVKDENSLLNKAFYRPGKTYQDPYNEITDKVGCRFVVFLNRDIRELEAAVQELDGFELSKDRDFEEEQKKNPISFDYAAVHYVARTAQRLVVEGGEVPVGISCEIQIKTLLQHAYSELTHDTIYKPSIEATPSMRRNAAKAMALMEATNDYFEKVADEVEAAVAPMRGATESLADVYRMRVGNTPTPNMLEGLIQEAFSQFGVDNEAELVNRLLDSKPGIAERIHERAATSLLYRQPAILLVYALADHNHRAVSRAWPLTRSELEPIFAHLGIAPRE